MQAFVRLQHRNEIKLSQRLSRRFPLRKELVRIAHSQRWLYSVTEPDKVLQHAMQIEDGSQESIDKTPNKIVEPYWAEHWQSAYALDEDLDSLLQETLPSLSRMFESSSRILELGCGGGVLSLGLSLRGLDVLATDYSRDAVLLTRLNAAANEVQIRTKVYDWNAISPLGCFDMIVAADVCYDRTAFVGLERCIKSSLASNGIALLAEPRRSMGDEFIDFLLDKGWSIRVQDATRKFDQANRKLRANVRYILAWRY